MRISLKPSTFQEFAGIDDVDVTIADARFCYFNYSGDNPQFSLQDVGEDFKLVLAVQFNEDGKEPGRPQAYSSGDKEFFRPEANGAYLVATGTKQALNSSTNASLFLASACNVGFPESALDSEQGVMSLVGTRCHVNQMAAPERSGSLVRTAAPGQKPFDPNKKKTILLVTRILALSGQTVPPPPTPLVAANKATSFPFGQNAPAQPVAIPKAGQIFTSTPVVASNPPANASPSNGQASEAVVAKAQETLINILAENGGTIKKKMLPPAAFRALGNDPLKGAVVTLIFDDKFLSSCPGIRFDGAEVTMG